MYTRLSSYNFNKSKLISADSPGFKTGGDMKSLSLCFIAFLFVQDTSLAQEPSISILPKEGFILELNSNNPQATLLFTVYNHGQSVVALDLGVESADSTYIIYIDEPDTNSFNGNI
jgi:hypothetical protein